jgi:hypothetical protein
MTDLIVNSYQENEPDVQNLKDNIDYHKNVLKKYHIPKLKSKKSKKSPKALYDNLGFFITNEELNNLENKTQLIMKKLNL